MRFLRTSLVGLGLLVLSGCSLGEYFAYREAAIISSQNAETSVSSGAHSGGSGGLLFLSGGSWNTDGMPLDEAMIAPNIAIKKRMIDNIDNAKKNVYLVVYLLTDTDIVQSLVDGKKRGLEVKVILEKEVLGIPNANRKSRDILASAGVEVISKADDGFSYVHAKTLITDETYVISTGNYTKSSFSSNREWFLFGKDAPILAYIKKRFIADFYENPFTEPIPSSLYISPENSRNVIEWALLQAQKRIIIYAQSLSDARMITILSDKKRAGVDVKVCLAKAKKTDTARMKLKKTLEEAKISFTETSGPTLHAKTIVADGVLLIGSENFTRNSLDANREIGRVLPYKAYEKMYRDTMERDCKWP